MFSKSRIPEMLEQCAGIDVHKKTAVTTIMIGFGEKMKKETKTFSTMTPDLRKLAQWLQENQIIHIIIESTGPYWKPIFNILEGEFGLNVVLANPYQVKNVPHRKSDVKDSEWLCYLLKHGFINPSFIPPMDIRNLKEVTRLRYSYTIILTGAKNRLIKMLESKNIKISSVLSDVYGSTGYAVIRLIASGETDPKILAKCFTNKKIKASKDTIEKALTGTLHKEDITVIQFLLRHIDEQVAIIEDVDKEIEAQMIKYAPEASLLKGIPGISDKVAQTIISEAGVNMSAFPTAENFASWTGLVPRTNESAGKRKNTSISGGNRYIRQAFVQAAWAAIKTKGTYWYAEFQRLCPKLGVKVAIVAIARKLAECVYSTLSSRTSYQERGVNGVNEQVKQKRIKYYQKMLKQLGVTIQVADPLDLAAAAHN